MVFRFSSAGAVSFDYVHEPIKDCFTLNFILHGDQHKRANSITEIFIPLSGVCAEVIESEGDIKFDPHPSIFMISLLGNSCAMLLSRYAFVIS